MEEVENQPLQTEESTPKKTNSIALVAVIVAVVAVVLVFAVKNTKQGSTALDSSTAPEVPPTESVESTVSTESVKEFTVDGSSFKFDPDTLTVNKGDTVKITFKDDDGMHNLVIDGYNVQTETIKDGAESSVTFVADKAGTFEYYCSVGTHKEKGMVGSLIVQ